MKSLFYAAINFVCLSFALVVPAALGAPPQYVVLVGAVIVGMQAAQSTVVQSNIERLPFHDFYRWFALLVVVLATGSTYLLVNQPGLLPAVFMTFSGAALGLSVGRDALVVLAMKGSRAYQKRVAERSLSLLVTTGIGALFPGYELAAFVGIFSGYVFFRAQSYNPHGASRVPASVYWVASVGLVGSLFYRNDTTWFRNAVSDYASFSQWNLYLVLYAGVQAIVGLLVVHFVFSDRNKWRIFYVTYRLKILSGSVMLMLFCIVAGFVAVSGAFNIIVSCFLSLFLVTLTGLVSGYAHAWSQSWAPYSAGILGTGVLLLGLQQLEEPITALVLANAVTLFIALTGTIKANGRG